MRSKSRSSLHTWIEIYQIRYPKTEELVGQRIGGELFKAVTIRASARTWALRLRAASRLICGTQRIRIFLAYGDPQTITEVGGGGGLRGAGSQDHIDGADEHLVAEDQASCGTRRGFWSKKGHQQRSQSSP